MAANVQIQQILIKRGNTAQIAAYTGPIGEPIYNTQTKTIHMQDGVNAGGSNLATYLQLANLTSVVANLQANTSSLYSNANVAAYLPGYTGNINTNLMNFVHGGQINTNNTGAGGATGITITANISNDINGIYIQEGIDAEAQLYTQGPIYFYTDTSGAAPQWTLGVDGSTDLPGNLDVAGNINFTNSSAGNITGANNITTGTLYASGNVTIVGNLIVNGNTTTVNTNNFIVDDNIIYMANANPANSLDIGFAGHFNNGTYQHTGLVRQATTGQWKLFSNVIPEPGNTINFTNAVYDAIQVGDISSPTITDLYSNAAIQSANIATLISNAAIQSANIATLTANAASQAADITTLYANAGAQANSLLGANAAIVTANTAMKGYVDAVTTAWTANAATQQGLITTLQANVGGYYIWANANTAGLYNSILGANAAIVTANTAMKAYVDAVTTAWTANAATQQGLISTLQTNAATQDSSINSINANIGGFYTWANTNFGTSNYTNSNIVAYNTSANLLSIGFSNLNLQSNTTALFVGNTTAIYNNGYGTNVNTTEILNNLYRDSNGTLRARGTGGISWLEMGSGGLFLGLNSSVTKDAAYTVAYNFGVTTSYVYAYKPLYIPSGSNIEAQSVLGITATSSVFSGNVRSLGNISADGNIIAPNYLFANGVNILSTIAPSSTYSNANVVANLQNYVTSISTTANITTTANVIAPNYLFANGVNILSTVSGASGTYSNTNVAAYLTTATITTTGNITAGNVISTGSYVVSNITTTGSYGNITGANVISANTISATNFVYSANGVSILSGITASSTYSNANVVANLQNFVTSISTTANITTTANMIAPNYLFANGVNILSTVTGGSGTYSNTNVAAYLTSGSVTGITLVNGATIKDTADLALAIGNNSGTTSQAAGGTAYGTDTGSTNQGAFGTAIGYQAGRTNQGTYAVAVGSAGYSNQGDHAVAIGNGAGNNGQGANSIAIGKFAGETSQAGRTIILNATGVAVNGVGAQTDSFYVTPIRNATGNIGILQYNSGTKEVTYSNTITTSDNITTTANVIAPNFLFANGVNILSTVSGGSSTYSNANVVANLANYVTNIVSTANITAGNLIGTQYGNTFGTTATFSGNVTAGNLIGTQYGNTFGTIATYTGNVTVGNLLVSGNIIDTGALSIISGSNGNISLIPNGTGIVSVTGAVSATGNVTAANIVTTGTTSGNISGANVISANTFQVSNGIFWANGTAWSSSSGGGTTYSNANVIAYLTAGNVSIGNVGYTVLPNIITQFTGNVNSYAQINVQNINSGTAATTEIVATANNGTDTIFFVDLGIAGNTYNVNAPNNSLGNVIYANDAYLYAQGNTIANIGGNLAIGATTPGRVVTVFAGGINNTSTVATFANTGLTVTANITAGNIIATQYGNSIGTTATYSGNITAANIVTTGTYGNITNANVISANNISLSGFGVTMVNRPAFRVYGSGVGTWNTTANVNLKGGTLTVDYNQGSYFNSTTGVFTAPVAGLYQTTLIARVGSNNGLNQIGVFKNGSSSGANVIAFWETDTNVGTATHFGVSGVAKLAIGDWLSANIVSGNVNFDQNDSWTITYIG